MAKFNTFGLDEAIAAFGRISNIPDETRDKALDAMADVAKAAVKAQGEAMGVRDPESSVHILDVITTTDPEKTPTGGREDITFKGKRTRGNTKTRNAEIAFINEYGKRGQPARPFIGTAMAKKEKQITDAGAEVLGDWLEKTF